MHKIVSIISLCALVMHAGAIVPKGHLVIVGGGRDTQSIKQVTFDLAGGTNAVMLAITTAGGENGAKAGESFVRSYTKMGAAKVKWAQPTREQSDDPKYVEELLKDVTGVYFTGGKQRYIAANHRGTLLHKKIMELYENGALISGSSAGAAMMSDPMLTGYPKGTLKTLTDQVPEAADFKAIAKDQVETVGGMGFIKGAIIDQHFIKRTRQNRLFSVALDHPDYTCIGIDESTSIVVSNGNRFKVVGKSNVMVIEPGAKSIKTNDQGDYSARDLKVHLLVDGDMWEIGKRK